MVLRGTIASYTNEGSGTVLVNGSQYPFTRENVWQSALEPRQGMPVDVTFIPEVGIAAMVAVEDQPILVPPVTPLSPASPPHTGASALASPADLVDLVAVLATAVAWFALPAVSIHLPWLEEIHLTFWQILGHFDLLESINAADAGGSTGLALQLASIACLFAALLPLVWHVRWAKLGGVLPLAIMALATVAVERAIQKALSQPAGLMGELGRAVAREVEKQMHPAVGAWIAAFAVLWLAGHAIWKFALHKQ